MKKPDNELPVTIDFIDYNSVNEGFIVIELTPGDPVFHTHFSETTDEGWGSSSTCWTLDLDAGVVIREWRDDGMDCDGVFTQFGEDVCPINELHTRVPHGRTKDTAKFMLPAWREKSRGQRDHSAESSGY